MSDKTQEKAVAVNLQTARLAQAYLAVFGTEGARTSDQELVYRDLADRAAVFQSMFVQNSDYSFDPLRAAHRDGARTLFLTIPNQIRLAAQEKQTKKVIK